MWNEQTLADLVDRKPQGGTFWTRSHRTVRYLRNLFLDDVTISVMSDIAKGRPTDVYLFVKVGGEAAVDKFSTRDGLDVGQLLGAPALSLVPEEAKDEVEKFISTPHETHLPTW